MRFFNSSSRILWWYAITSYLLLFIRDLTSISSNFAIRLSVCKSGWLTLVHHLDTVEGFLPSSSASHLLVFFFSTRTILSRFKSSMSQVLWFERKVNEFSRDGNYDCICYGAYNDSKDLVFEECCGDYDFGVIATWYMARVMRHNLGFESLMTYLAMIMWALSCDTVDDTILTQWK